ncbi:DoxX family protein [Methylobacterium iners]|uniref:DoxX family protein n=1 Tax=Methylobacterium iners TaxID=418707 RepID=A0ABQ4RZL3_9HYPH|nr:DoxX family protein [Methylobacterium iners]GJD95608.1 hypothetical protein OCOJLMKI_2821 [Methylobacterium iners]
MRWLLVVLYGGVGLAHLVATDRILPIVPEWVPAPRLTLIATGLCELAGAVALLLPRWLRLAGGLLAAYAICVFPANMKHAWEAIPVEGLPDSWWYHGPRLALQPVLVWFALYAVHLTDWPFGAAKADPPR